MFVKAVVPVIGHKTRLSDTIVAHLQKHNNYFDIFCGSLATLMSKPVSAAETVCDLNGDLTNLFYWIAADGKLYRMLRRTIITEQLFKDSIDALRMPMADTIERAYHFFIVSWCTRNGASNLDTAGEITYRRNSEHHAPRRLRNAIDSMPRWRDRLRNVLVLNRDAFDVLKSIPDKREIAIYLDPPWFGSEHRYQRPFTVWSHNRLATMLNQYQNARIVLSYYHFAAIKELYPENDWTYFKFTHLESGEHGVPRGGAAKRGGSEYVLVKN